MNIGVDVDGVLTDLQGFHKRHAPPFFKRKFNRDAVDESLCDIRDIYRCTEDERYAYWKKYLLKYVTVEPARKGAKAFTRRLHSDGHKVFIITKRVFSSQEDFMGKLMRFLLKNWLWRNGITYDEVVFCDNDVSDSKRTACLDKHIDVMIDDEPENIEAIAPIAKVICFNTSYNQTCKGENIERATDWDEIYELIR